MTPQSDPPPGPPVIVVSGLPRSGTSMMMRMLEAGGVPVLTDQVREPDRDNPNGYYEFERIKRVRQDASWLAGARGSAVKAVYLLLYDLPPEHHYRVILMRRTLEEVVASQAVMLQRSGKPQGRLSEADLVRIFTDHLRRLDAWVRAQPNFAVLDVDYNALLRDPAPPVDRIARFLDRDLDTEAMCRVVDPTLYRQRAILA